jgi:hypothetical protein
MGVASIIELMDELYNTYILQFNILVSEAQVVQGLGLLKYSTLVIASNVNNLRLEDLLVELYDTGGSNCI